MENLELREQDEDKFQFKPLSFQFLKASEWDGVTQDLKWLWPWIRPYQRGILAALFSFTISTSIAVSIPKIIASIIDEQFIAKKGSLEVSGAGLAFVMLLKILLDICYKWIISKQGQTITREIRSDIFYELGLFPLSFFDQNSSGRVISRCVNDISNLSSFFSISVFTIASDLALIIGSLIFLVTISWKAAFATTLVLLPLSIFMLNVSQAQMRWGRDQRNILSRLSSHTSDTMNNLMILHSQSMNSKWINRHRNLQSLYSRVILRNIFTWASFSSTHVLLMGLTYSLVISAGIFDYKSGSLSLGSMIASFTYVALIFGPLFEISEKLNIVVTALGSVKRLKHILPRKHGRSSKNNVSGQAPQGPILFKDVTFSYRKNVLFFKDFTLELPEGEVTALVGRTGSGKTTLSHLMLGLYPLTSGQIFWGEEVLSDFTPARKARWIGHVSQDLFIFSDTLRENLRLWRSDVTDQQIQECLELVGLWGKIKNFPDSLDMIVKPEILPLSQGEKQLLLLCRALLQDPRLLVFDEATASLDQMTEDEWLRHVSKLFKDRTILFIAHRLETLKLASKIVVLENGKIKKSFRKPVGQSVSYEDIH